MNDAEKIADLNEALVKAQKLADALELENREMDRLLMWQMGRNNPPSKPTVELSQESLLAFLKEMARMRVQVFELQEYNGKVLTRARLAEADLHALAEASRKVVKSASPDGGVTTRLGIDGVPRYTVNTTEMDLLALHLDNLFKQR